MNILVTGATGFLGSKLARALLHEGHRLLCPVRDPVRAKRRIGAKENLNFFFMDFATCPAKEEWLPHLVNIELVINAVGILRERPPQTFDALHARAPVALFEACVLAGISKVIQISALGADSGATSRYHLSKRTADRRLAELPVDSVVVQPSLVYGQGGSSAKLFNLLASVPVLALPDGGDQAVQPIHLDDLVDGIVALVAAMPRGASVLPFVGEHPATLRDYLATLRRSMDIRNRAWVISVPASLVRPMARIAGRIPGSLFDEETFAMLQRGNAADSRPLTRLLGHPPRDAASFIERDMASTTKVSALLAWLLPCLRIAISLMWLWTGIVSLGLYPVEESYALLARLGATGAIATVLLYGAAAMDLILGILTLTLKGKHRRRLWIAQFFLVGLYTVLITIWLPEYWLHPYGPILKNLPLLIAILLLYELEGSTAEGRSL